MTRALKTILVATIAIACFGCNSTQLPTKAECRDLLHSQSTTREEMLRFIERAKRELEAMPANRVDVHSEGLGLCTGALMRKAGLSK